MNLVLWLGPFVNGVGLGVLAMLLHECGHLVTAKMLGVRVKKVGFGWRKGIYIRREQGSPLESILIALAGPLANIIMIPLSHSVPLFALANCCYALGNLLPIDGSDGSRVAICFRSLWQTARDSTPPDA